MTGTYEPDSGLRFLLEAHLQYYEEDYESYWGLQAEEPPDGVEDKDWRLARLLDAVGKHVLDCVKTLGITPELAAVSAQHGRVIGDPEAVRDLSSYVIAQDRAEIQLAWEAIGLLGESKGRVIQLLYFLSQFSLSTRAAAYLNRATRLYIWGFDPEVPIMSRAVLEAALEDRIAESELGRLGYKRSRHGYQPWQYVDAARSLGILDSAAADTANEIRQAGNVAVHVTPGIGPNAFFNLASLTLVLRDLYP